ncbi:MAG: hypothetical protein A2Y62_02590 [Candidatus Fischerbacteria bacterium RBG_13_37_8]|uniref:Fido domain-containing protein n=1 Tax=Candidatus Fischerbacteria bacterium RBG_13_37_8 TaxID=1817863 RepID=A0A1F5V5E0_9BACT|nr:MAG: hypothetical protein A2Y62_02590 [Candidatus Fischerbacteria bacterium RBG_13_37_8]
MRTYEKTHSWLQFSINLEKAPVAVWIMLGECQSKCEHIAMVPLKPNVSKELHQIYLAKGIAATTAIEGNSLSEEQARLLIEGKLKVPVSLEYQKNEIDNILRCCNHILKKIKQRQPIVLSPNIIKYFNAEVLKNTIYDSDVMPGKVRKHSVGVAQYRGAPAEDCEYLLEKLCEWLNGEQFKAGRGMTIATAILKAMIAHLYMAWIHPFGDGNGRTARLIELLILINAGVPAPAAQLLSNHYNNTRQEYYKQLADSSKTKDGGIAFIAYAVQGFLDGLKEQLDRIWEQQWTIAWENLIHEVLPDKVSATQIRRRHLILDLSHKEKPVPLKEITDASPRIAREYAKKSRKTLIRDLNELIRLDLLELTPKGYRVRLETILQFLPTKLY